MLCNFFWHTINTTRSLLVLLSFYYILFEYFAENSNPQQICRDNNNSFIKIEAN